MKLESGEPGCCSLNSVGEWGGLWKSLKHMFFQRKPWTSRINSKLHEGIFTLQFLTFCPVCLFSSQAKVYRIIEVTWMWGVIWKIIILIGKNIIKSLKLKNEANFMVQMPVKEINILVIWFICYSSCKHFIWLPYLENLGSPKVDIWQWVFGIVWTVTLRVSRIHSCSVSLTWGHLSMCY